MISSMRRFSLLLSASALLLPVAGCSDNLTTTGSTAGCSQGLCGLAGAGGAGAGKGTGSDGAGGADAGKLPVGEGAWSVVMTAGSSATCPYATFTSSVGSISDQGNGAVVTDGTMSTSIACSVTQSAKGAFDVRAQGIDSGANGSTLEIEIASITPGASQSSPAVGRVTFLAPQTADDQYSSLACNFYFSSASEGVGLGKVWLTFECPSISNGSSMTTCQIPKSYAIFENCLTM